MLLVGGGVSLLAYRLVADPDGRGTCLRKLRRVVPMAHLTLEFHMADEDAGGSSRSTLVVDGVRVRRAAAYVRLCGHPKGRGAQ